MSTLTGPLLSFGARKTIGKTVTYSSWKGIPYARQRVIPANPRSTDQTEVRSLFGWLQRVWAYSPAIVTDSWDAYAEGQPLTGRNALTKFNVEPMQGDTDLTNFTFVPAAKSGPVAAGVSFTPGNDLVTVGFTAPVLPSGWTIAAARAACIRQQDPQTGILYQVTAGEDATSTYEVVLSSLASAQTYFCAGWFKYNRPDGSFAYGPPIQGTALTT